MGNVEALNNDGADYGRPEAHQDNQDDLELKVVRKRCRGKGPASRLTSVVVEKKRKHVDAEPKKRKLWPNECCQGRDQTVTAATTPYQGFEFGVHDGFEFGLHRGTATAMSEQGFSFTL
eukprot:6492391-Amphidinium_carterae.2